MIIVAAEQQDLPQIVDIYNQAIKAGQHTTDTDQLSLEERQQWFDSHSDKKYPLYIAKEDDQVLGYLTISAYRYGRKALMNTAEISYYIHFEHHRKGVASQLIDYAISKCHAANIETLIAILISCNKPSIKLLEKNGFIEWGRMPNIVKLKNGSSDHLYYGLHLNQ